MLSRSTIFGKAGIIRGMFLQLLQFSPAIAVVWILAIILSLTVHEFSHALVGKWKGDKTAEREGRLTLNPLSHLDPMGFFALLFLGFGWAKPVPFNPYNLKNPKWDAVVIALAGPAANLLMAAVAALILRFSLPTIIVSGFTLLHTFLLLTVIINLFLLFFNVLPIHPLDGSKLVTALLDSPKHVQLRQFIMTRGSQILTILVIVSVLTNIDVFGFLSTPAFGLCSTMVGISCPGLFGVVFGG